MARSLEAEAHRGIAPTSSSRNSIARPCVWKAMTLRWLVALLCMLLAACGTAVPSSFSASAAPPTESPEPVTPQPAHIGPDGGESAEVDDLLAYGERHPETFGGLYLDSDVRRIVMHFTDDIEEHATAVAEILPGTIVRRARFSEAALTDLFESLDFEALEADGIFVVSAAVDISENHVTLEGQSNDPTAELRLELAHGGMLDVTLYPVPGEWANASEGPGWRLLAAGRSASSEAYTVRAATTDAAWDELWEALDLGGERPAPGLSDEMVVSFGHGIGSSCPELRLDGVAIEGGVVYSQTSDPLAPRACTLDQVAAAVFVVALDRTALPADGFTLRLSRETVTCDECGFSEEIEVALP